MFIAATLGHCRFDMFGLGEVEVEISDDMLACLDAIRWRRAQLADLVADGWERAEAISERWGYRGVQF